MNRILISVLVLVGGCGLDARYFPDTSGTFLESEIYGLKVTDFAEWGDSARRTADGSIEYFGEATVSIRGAGDHRVQALGQVGPLRQGGRRSLVTVDLETGQERSYVFDAEQGALMFGDFEGGVFVLSNDDGSYTTFTGRFDAPSAEDEQVQVEDGFAAWRLIRDRAEVATSRHALVLAFAMAQSRLVPARGVYDWVGDHVRVAAWDDPSSGDLGAGVVICTDFRELCACILCDIGDYSGEQCAPCDED